jgi:hypothetical protein
MLGVGRSLSGARWLIDDGCWMLDAGLRNADFNPAEGARSVSGDCWAARLGYNDRLYTILDESSKRLGESK